MLLINDCYNANPLSMRAALANLAERAGPRRRVAVLGEMAELGADAPRYHREVADVIRKAGVAELVAVGPLARGLPRGRTRDVGLATAAEAADALSSLAAPRRRRARQGLACRGTRGRRGEARGERERLMARVLVAALVALIISILAGPKFIDFLRRNEFGQQIREEGPQHHSAKQGTPTMGGLLIVLAASIAFLATSDYTLPALTIFGTAVACGAIGFIDD